MKFENTFTVPAPVDDTWTTLLDLERVAPCMPGAEVLEQTGDNAYKVGIKVKVGPISMTYRGQVEITDRDDEDHRATMRVKAREARGQGTADATVRMGLDQFADGSQAKMETDLQLSGRAASMGRGVIGDVAEKLIETFAGNLAEMLGSGSGATVESPAVNETAGAAAAAEAPPASPEPPAAQAPVAAATAKAPPGSAAADGAAAAPAPTPPRAPTPPPAPTPSAAAPPPPPPPPPKPSGGGDSLNALDLAASVIAGRLKDPRILLIAVGVLGFLFYLIGYARGKRR
jgi:carbon monoxide dehydrogenase subunit G